VVSLLNKSSCLAAALGVTKSIAVIVMNRSHFVVLLKSDLDVQTKEHKTKYCFT
jgi:hypothetical protein